MSRNTNEYARAWHAQHRDQVNAQRRAQAAAKRLREQPMREARAASRQADRFWAKVDREPSGCWEFQGSRNGDGYGTVQFDGRVQGAHRVAWKLTHGAIPQGLYVLHSCDNPPCVNPSHLSLGTQQENALDAARKGRITHAKLTPEEVRAIRELAGAGSTVSSLARRFGVAKGAIAALLEGRTWTHVA